MREQRAEETIEMKLGDNLTMEGKRSSVMMKE